MKILPRGFWLGAAVPVLALLLGGCGGPRVGSTAYPCEQCNYGYVSVKKNVERRVWCVKDGKTLDCLKTPAECPECVRIQQSQR